MKSIVLSLVLIGLVAALGCSKQEKQETAQQPKAAQPQPEAAAPAAPAPTAQPGAMAEADGEKVYSENCATCHDNGVAGAPKLGDKEAWKPRIAEGMDSLVQTAINGEGAMPAKGGHPDLSDDQVKAAVAYMVEKSQ